MELKEDSVCDFQKYLIILVLRVFFKVYDEEPPLFGSVNTHSNFSPVMFDKIMREIIRSVRIRLKLG